jgi:ABC-type multidrug transport system permease subunit
MQINIKNLIRIGTFLLLIVSPVAHAYIGPGMGGGAIAVVFGILAAIFMAIFGFIYYPVKRWLKRRKADADK